VPLAELDIAGLAFEQMPLEAAHTELDLVLHVYERGASIRVVLEYRADLFEAETMARNAALLDCLLRDALAEPETGLDALAARLAEKDRALRAAARAERLAASRELLGKSRRRSLLGA
jgi:non-ribosomal peptide synthetase component F